ncbi:UvrD-helicase domain-containing protein [Bacillus sp. RD4P76]|uniref:DNA 3'-5' helicase n=1 Tax=Bacillus suaedaesalsae TaxID=2810349 RepID=A0ABS2DPJ6_9BACI|nr:UvrD-helicase domain-containing protein [Bacillus suaedaesalsae]
MQPRQFFNSPIGITNKEGPDAMFAETSNSATLISNQEKDAAYFRSLEISGIFLNASQIEAVRHKDGPMLTLAGAGSGKTSVLVCRTGYLLNVHNVDPRQILLVTFSKKAADEMKERIGLLPNLTPGAAKGIQASTFHSFFLTILRSRGYHQEILSSERQKQIMIKQIMKELGMGDTYQPETVLQLISSHKVNMIKDTAWPKETEDARKAYLKYEEWKRRTNKLDFDDILVESYELLSNNLVLLQTLRNRFQYVMVDEFQDTNLLQYELIKLLTAKSQNLFVVGDDDQTIYTFNGARNEFILNFDKQFETAKTIFLDINYRSTTPIVGLGNEVIKHNRKRKVKMLKATKKSVLSPQYCRPATTDDEAKWVINDIKEKLAIGSHRYADFAILHRTANNSRAIFEQLIIDKLPFIQFTGNDKLFYEHWTVKPILDHLRLALNPRDFDAMDGMVGTLYIAREKAMDLIWNEEQKAKKKYPLIHLATLPGLKSFQVEKIKERIKLMKEVKDLEPQSVIKKLRQSFYDKYLETEGLKQATVHKEDLKETLDELEASAKRFATISDFIRFIQEMSEQLTLLKNSKKQTESDAISLMTIHKAKGLEFRTVYLIGASEGILPHITAIEAEKIEDAGPKQSAKEKIEMALEEERRLAYVGITRAMEELYILSPSFYRGKKVEVSRFLLEAFGAQSANTNGSKATVLAWICSSAKCNGWQRIMTHEETESETKECPFCSGEMKKGSKEISSKS